MKNKRCKKNAHSWGCQETSGDLGEVLTIKPLNPFAVQTAINNPDQIKQVCPRGNIVCVKCQAFFLRTSFSLKTLGGSGKKFLEKF